MYLKGFHKVKKVGILSCGLHKEIRQKDKLKGYGKNLLKKSACVEMPHSSLQVKSFSAFYEFQCDPKFVPQRDFLPFRKKEKYKIV